MMKKNLLLLAMLLSMVVSSHRVLAQQKITFSDLLQEMTDRDRLAEFPSVFYASRQASSYNRESVSPDLPGWFADSDGVSCLRTETNNGREEWVLMEDDGPGCIAKIWAVCFYYGLDDTTGANVRIYIDGNATPVIEENFFDLVRGKGSVQPPFADESRRAGNLYLPIPYAKSCKVTMDKKAFYYIINYRSYPKDTQMESFTPALLTKHASLLKETGRKLTQGDVLSKPTLQKNIQLQPGKQAVLDLPKGEQAIRQFKVKLQAKDIPQALRSTVLKIQFDGEETVWCPVGDFFNNGVGHKAYQMWEREVTPDGTMICRWTMPYRSSAKLSLENVGTQPVDASVSITTGKRSWTDASMYFHANWRMDDPTPTFPLFDYNLISVKGSGVIVGDQFTVLNPTEGWWGEGDEKIYIDEDVARKFPSHFGTGTEDYYGWAGGVVPTPADEFSKPFLANVLVGNPNAKGYNTCSRTRVMDAIPFREQLVFDIESSCGTRQGWYHLQYATATFWYAKPGATYNRAPLPEMAARRIMTVDELQAFNEAKKGEVFTVPGAIECENLTTYKVEGNVEADPSFDIWGEVSNGAMKSFLLQSAGDVVNVKITERFAPAHIRLCAAVGPQMGTFDIYINGELKKTQSFNTGHSGMSTPYIDLGVCTPVDNAFDIQFKPNKLVGNSILGLDFFLVEE